MDCEELLERGQDNVIRAVSTHTTASSSRQPGTPDVGEEHTANGVDMVGTAKDGWVQWMQKFSIERKKRSLYVELDVGSAIDPEDVLGKYVKIFCPTKNGWFHGTIVSYHNDIGLHNVAFEDGKQQMVALPAFRVRFPHILGEPLPDRPPLERVTHMQEALTYGVKHKRLPKNVKHAMKRAVEYLEERKDDPVVEDVPLVTLYHPGEPVWAKVGKYKPWPAVVMTLDQIEKESTCNTVRDGVQSLALYFLGTYEHFLTPIFNVTGLSEGFEKSFQTKTKSKIFQKSMEELEMFLKEGIIPPALLHKFDTIDEVLAADADLELLSSEKKKDTPMQGKGQHTKKPTKQSRIDRFFGDESTSSSMKAYSGSTCGNGLDLSEISTNSLEVLSLGYVDFACKNHYVEGLIWPVGFTVRKKMKSLLSKSSAWHTLEVLKPNTRDAEPAIRIKFEENILLEGSASSPEMVDFLRKKTKNDSIVSFTSPFGARFIGVGIKRIAEAIRCLPHADQFLGHLARPKSRLSSSILAAGTMNPLLLEILECQLPEDIKAVPLPEERPYECQICGEADEDEDDFILQCDGCRVCVHMSCYAVQEAPHGRLWLCDVCSSAPKTYHRPACALCPVKGGAMKRTTCGKWCHPACALWLPETFLIREKTHMHLVGLIDGLQSIHKSRFEARCCICKQKYGACVQCCSESKCYKTFHFMCARTEGCLIRMEQQSDDEEEEEQELKDSNDSDSVSEQVRKKRKQKKRKKLPSHIVVSGTKLLVNCPKHSSLETGLQRNPSDDGSNAILSIDADEFEYINSSMKDLTLWRANHSRINKSRFLEPIGLSLGGSRQPSLGTEDVKSSCTNFSNATIKSDSLDILAPAPPLLAKSEEEKKIVSQAENFYNMLRTWKHSVIPGKSAIHAWGAFAARDFAAGEFVIEYVGELVRPSVAEMRERRLYDSLVGAGTYVFRLNTDTCVDATRSGNLAHLLNHSCEPNCVSRTLSVMDPHLNKPIDHVVIIALRAIHKGEELTYDYRFCGEEVLVCNCGTQGCRRMVNLSKPENEIWVPASEIKQHIIKP